MLSMAEEAKSKGVELGFFVGNSKIKFDNKGEFAVNGIKFSSTKILVQYDSYFSPQMLAKHEIGHAKWKTPEWQKMKDIILGGLSETDKKEKILSQKRYMDYKDVYDGNMDFVWERICCRCNVGTERVFNRLCRHKKSLLEQRF